MDQPVGLAHEGMPWRPQIENIVDQVLVRLAQVQHLIGHTYLGIIKTEAFAIDLDRQVQHAGAAPKLVGNFLGDGVILRHIDRLRHQFGLSHLVKQPALVIGSQ